MNQPLDQAVADFARKNLQIQLELIKKDEFSYKSVPLCVIDAVYSMGVKYESTKAVVVRFRNYLSIERSESSDAYTTSDLMSLYAELGIEFITDSVFKNRQRTSTCNGILKSEAIFRFLSTLQKYKVETLDDIDCIKRNAEFDSEIYRIPGQSSGICLKYFFILTGLTDFIKPDRMIQRFFRTVLASNGISKSKISHDQMQDVITGACDILRSDYPWIKPAYIDHFIWRYQREKKKH